MLSRQNCGLYQVRLHMTLLNWIFVPIAFAFGIGAASFVCVILLLVLEPIVLEVTAMVGLLPSRSLEEVLISAVLCIGCIIGAVITVLLPALSAPKYKKEIAHVAFVLGAVILGALVLGSGHAVPYVAALGAGVASVLYVGSVSQLQPNISLGTDAQQQDASSRRPPRAGQL